MAQWLAIVALNKRSRPSFPGLVASCRQCSRVLPLRVEGNTKVALHFNSLGRSADFWQVFFYVTSVPVLPQPSSWQ